MAIFAVALALAVVYVVVLWPLSLIGHLIGLTPSFDQLTNRPHGWLHEHYPLVGLRYLGVVAIVAAVVVAALVAVNRALEPRRAQARELALQAEIEAEAARQAAEHVRLAKLQAQEQQRMEQAAERRRLWLAAPPEPLDFPERFSQRWLTMVVPTLHPGQVPMLKRELKARGWTPEKIRQRVDPLLPRGGTPSQVGDA